jgi:hypothetical protein
MRNDGFDEASDGESPNEGETSEEIGTGAEHNEPLQPRAADSNGLLAGFLGGGILSARLRQEYAAAIAPIMEAVNAQNKDVFSEMSASVQQIANSRTSISSETVAALIRRMAEVPSLTKPQYFAPNDEAQSAYSTQLNSPEDYFKADEGLIDSFNDLHSAITKLITKTNELPLVWRGVSDSRWGLHSSLFRQLMNVNGVVPPSKHPTKLQPYPNENQMVVAESEILRLARSDWRFDNISALETFARIQHSGGPTRLIDVTKNPYVAAWFAVENDGGAADKDGRLFAIATRPVAKPGKPPHPDSTLQLDHLGAGRDPFWHLIPVVGTRQQLDWGTGARRLIWVPPAYDPRISAQNAAFLLDGVPITSAKTAPHLRISHNTFWRRADLLASTSIYAKMSKPTAKPQSNGANLAPTYSFRITAKAKADIRDVLEDRFGYRRSYIYPDMSGLAKHLTTLELNQHGEK